jgi:hypothetical protein
MTTISSIGIGRCEMVVDALRAEFGAILAQRILEDEAIDFLWEARVQERYLGQHMDAEIDFDGDAEEFARIVILSFLDDRWHAGLCLVDGEGRAVGLLWKRSFERREQAEAVFERAG